MTLPILSTLFSSVIVFFLSLLPIVFFRSAKRWRYLPELLFVFLVNESLQVFGVSHALSFHGYTDMHFDIPYFCSTFISSVFYMALLRSSGSLLIPVLVHNLVNVGICLVQWLK